MCWVAMDRGARLAERRGHTDHTEEWQAEAEEIRAEILERGVDGRGVFRQHYETDALDASTLLVPLFRFLPPDDERVRATVCAIRDELTEGGLVLRHLALEDPARLDRSDVALRRMGQQRVHRVELAELLEMLDRGEDELDVTRSVGVERLLWREPAEVHALATVDPRLLSRWQRCEEEVRVEADLHLRRRDPARELHQAAGVLERDRRLLTQLSYGCRAVGVVSVSLAGVDGAA